MVTMIIDHTTDTTTTDPTPSVNDLTLSPVHLDNKRVEDEVAYDGVGVVSSTTDKPAPNYRQRIHTTIKTALDPLNDKMFMTNKAVTTIDPRDTINHFFKTEILQVCIKKIGYFLWPIARKLTKFATNVYETLLILFLYDIKCNIFVHQFSIPSFIYTILI